MTVDRLAERLACVDYLRRRYEFVAAEDALLQAVAMGLDPAGAEICRGRLDVRRGRDESALQHFEKAIELDPSSESAAAWRVGTLSRLYRYGDALTAAADGQRRFPGSAAVGVALGRSYLDQECPVAAVAEFEEVLARHADDEPALRWRVIGLGDLYRYQDAEEAGHGALKRSAESPRIATSLAGIYQRQGRYEDAITWVGHALRAEPDYAGALQMQVKVLRAACLYADAETAATQAVGRLPQAAILYVEWSLLRRDEGRHAEALELLARALAIQPDHRRALEWRIVVLTDLHRYADAEEAANEALRHHPRSPQILESLAWSHQAQGQWAQAQEAYDRALEIDTCHLASVDGRATALRRMSRYGEAEAYLAKMVQRFPHAVELYVEWGLLEDAQGRAAAALERFERALEIDPCCAFALEMRVTELRNQKRYADAATAADEAVRRRPDARLWVEYGWVYANQERHDEALAAFEHALDIDQANPWAHGSKISVLVTLKQFADAGSAARTAIELLPCSAYMHQQLAWIYAYQDLDELALAEFRHAAELDRGDSTWPEYIALALRWLHRYADGEAVLRDAIGTWPDEPRLRNTLGWIFADQRRYDEAFAEFERAAELDPANALALVWRIYALRRSRRYAEAEDTGRDSVKQRPDEDELWVQLSFVYSDQGRFKDAEDVLQEALKHRPDSSELVISLVNLYDRLGREKEALALVERVLKEEKRNSVALRLRIDLLDDLQLYPEAERACREAITIHPTDPDFVIRLGNLQHNLGHYVEALTEFERAAEMDPSRHVRYAQAATLRQLGRYEEAGGLLRVEVERRPNYPDSYIQLCKVLREQGRYDDALAAAQQAVQADAYYSDAHVACIGALRCLGRLTEARSAACDAVRRMPYEADLTLELGRIHDDRHEHAEALTCFDRALELAPIYNEVLTARSATLRSLRRFADAERMLRPAIDRYPRVDSLRTELGWVYRDQGCFSDGERIFAQLRDDAVSGTGRAGAFNGLGWIAFTRDDYTAAERYFRQALDADPLNHDSRLGLAWSLARQDEPARWPEAESLCQDILVIQPRNHLAHTCLGVLYDQRDDYPAAEYHLRRTIELDPYNGSYVDLGALYVQLARFTEAEEMLAKALRHDWYDVQAHIELGSMHLQREFDLPQAGAGARQAVEHFRQAMVISPANGPAAIGLALALSRSHGDLLGAEGVLRDALDRAEAGSSKSQLLLALARMLIERGDTTQRDELYLEALALAQGAIELAATEPEAYFVAGVAAYKAGENTIQVSARPFYRRRTVRFLRQCLERDPGNAEARRTMLLAQESLKVARSSLLGSGALAILAAVLLATLWSSFFVSHRVTSLMLTTLTPILVGLVALGFVLPFLIRLKLPGGVEADLSASLHQVSAGPTGDMIVGPGRIGTRLGENMRTPTLSPGPRGHLPRLE